MRCDHALAKLQGKFVNPFRRHTEHKTVEYHDQCPKCIAQVSADAFFAANAQVVERWLDDVVLGVPGFEEQELHVEEETAGSAAAPLSSAAAPAAPAAGAASQLWQPNAPVVEAPPSPQHLFGQPAVASIPFNTITPEAPRATFQPSSTPLPVFDASHELWKNPVSSPSPAQPASSPQGLWQAPAAQEADVAELTDVQRRMKEFYCDL